MLFLVQDNPLVWHRRRYNNFSAFWLPQYARKFFWDICGHVLCTYVFEYFHFLSAFMGIIVGISFTHS